MKTILNPTGGRPIKNEDVELIEQFVTMYNDLFGRINAASNEFIISGCDITGGGISAGFIYYDGDICTFAGAASVATIDLEKVSVDSSPREFYDSVTRNSMNTVTVAAQIGGGLTLNSSTPRLDEFMLRKVTTPEAQDVFEDSAVLTPYSLLVALQYGTNYAATTLNKGVVEKATTAETQNGTAEKYIDAELLQNAAGEWQTPSYESNFSAGTPAFKYRLNKGILEFRGEISNTTGLQLAFNLPAAYRPAADVYIPFLQGAARDSLATLLIETNGDVSSPDFSTASTIVSYFNNPIILD